MENEILEKPNNLSRTVTDVLEDKTQEQIIQEHHRKGTISNEGWRTEDGELIPRFKKEPRMGMSVEDEYTVEQWVKQMKRDFPEVDPAICDLIATHCYLHPDKAKDFVKERTDNPVKPKDDEEYFKQIGLERINY